WTPDASPAAEAILVVFMLVRVAPSILLGLRLRRDSNPRSEVIHGLITTIGAAGALIGISDLALNGGGIGTRSAGLLSGFSPDLTVLLAALIQLTAPIVLFAAIGLVAAVWRPSRESFFISLWIVGAAIQLSVSPGPPHTLIL